MLKSYERESLIEVKNSLSVGHLPLLNLRQSLATNLVVA